MRHFLLIAAFMAAAGLVAACGDDDDDGSIDLGERADAVGTTEPDGLQYVLDTLGQDVNIEEMRPHLAPDLQGVADEDLLDAVACFPPGVVAALTDTQIEQNDDTATLVVTWEVTGAGSGEEQTVERTWRFERIDPAQGGGAQESSFVISELPQTCPFEPADEDQQMQDDAPELEDGSATATPQP